MRLITFGSLGHNAQIDSYLLLWGYRFQGSILLTISSFKLLGFTAGIMSFLLQALPLNEPGHESCRVPRHDSWPYRCLSQVPFLYIAGSPHLAAGISATIFVPRLRGTKIVAEAEGFSIKINSDKKQQLNKYVVCIEHVRKIVDEN